MLIYHSKILGLFLSMISFSCSAGEYNIYTVNYPLQYFSQRIGGDNVEVFFPAPRGIDPAYWQPEASVLNLYQSSDLILLNGAGYAKWVNLVSLPRLKSINTSSSFRDKYIPVDTLTRHTHGGQGEHVHGQVFFTTWLDLSNAVSQAQAIKNALQDRLPEHSQLFETNFNQLQLELNKLHNQLKSITKGKHEIPLLASHPVYEYLSEGYGLNLKSMHFEPDQYPGAIQWAELDELLKVHKASWMIWEDKPLEEVEHVLMQKGIKSIVFDPVANIPDTGDFLSQMQINVENLRKVFADY